jgi:hypothetical protein
LILGGDAEAARRFYLYEVEDGSGQECRIGVVSSDFGIRPFLLLRRAPATLIVCRDAAIDVVSLVDRAVLSSVPLDGAFFELIEIDGSSDVLVISELGASRLSATGESIWSVSTQVLENWRIRPDGVLVLQEMDGEGTAVLNLATGLPSI